MQDLNVLLIRKDLMLKAMTNEPNKIVLAVKDANDAWEWVNAGKLTEKDKEG